MFSGVSEKKIVLLITRCENDDQKRKEAIKKDILQHPELKSLLSIIEDRIFFTGALDKNHFDSGQTSIIKSELRNIMNMRSEIYQYIFSLKEPVHLSEVGFVKREQEKAEEIVKRMEALKDELTNTGTAMEEAQITEKIKTLSELSRDLVKLHVFIPPAKIEKLLWYWLVTQKGASKFTIGDLLTLDGINTNKAKK